MGWTSMKISITQSDIDQGKRHEARFCPIAMAASRAFHRDIWIGWIRGYSHPHVSPEVVFSLPADARVFVQEFDDGKEVQPFEFEV